MSNTYPVLLGATQGNERAITSTYEVKVTDKELGDRTRNAQGQLQVFVLARKKEFEFSFVELPDCAANTWDGGIGFDELYELYDTGGICYLVWHDGDGAYLEYLVRFDESFDHEILKRKPYYAYKLKFKLVEV